VYRVLRKSRESSELSDVVESMQHAARVHTLSAISADQGVK
jgi:hypothetical protein